MRKKYRTTTTETIYYVQYDRYSPSGETILFNFFYSALALLISLPLWVERSLLEIIGLWFIVFFIFMFVDFIMFLIHRRAYIQFEEDD